MKQCAHHPGRAVGGKANGIEYCGTCLGWWRRNGRPDPLPAPGDRPDGRKAKAGKKPKPAPRRAAPTLARTPFFPSPKREEAEPAPEGEPRPEGERPRLLAQLFAEATAAARRLTHDELTFCLERGLTLERSLVEIANAEGLEEARGLARDALGAGT